MTNINAQAEKRIIKFVSVASWIMLSAATAAGQLIFNPSFALGVACGGLICTVNFSLLSRTINKVLDARRIERLDLTTRRWSVYMSVLVRYYIRLFFSGVIILLLLAGHLVAPLGLVIGLSVVVASIFLALAYELTCHFKEA